MAIDGLRFARPGGLEVLDDLSFSIAPGEVVAVVGPSGCGKSTLLSLLAGLLTPTGGSIRRHDRDSGAIPTSSRARKAAKQLWLTLMFQEETLLPWRTVAKNVQFGLERLGVPRAERTHRTDQLLAMVGLSDFASARPIELSGGMRRRVQFAACVAPFPKLLLLDEPFSALDEPTRVKLHADVLRVVYQLGIAVVLVTHDISEAVSIADHVIVLTRRPGRVIRTVSVPFGRDRDVFTLRESAEYQSLYKILWRLIWDTYDSPNGTEPSAEP